MNNPMQLTLHRAKSPMDKRIVQKEAGTDPSVYVRLLYRFLGRRCQEILPKYGGNDMSDRVRKPPPPGFRWVFCPRFKHWRTGKYVYPKNAEYFAFLVRC